MRDGKTILVIEGYKWSPAKYENDNQIRHSFLIRMSHLSCKLENCLVDEMELADRVVS